MKRIVMIALIVSLLMVTNTQADETPMRKLTLEANISGDELDVCIYADMKYDNSTSAFESLDFELTYSKDVLELIESVKNQGVLESEMIDGSFIYQEAADVPGRYGLHAASALGHAGTGLLVHLRFRIIGEGYYGFKLAREGYSVYDSASNQSTSYYLPRLDIHAELQTKSSDSSLSAGTDTTASPIVLPTSEPKENGFMRFIHSIFGTSCSGCSK